MSHLFFGTSPETMALHLAETLEDRLRAADPFVPVEIVVPNPYLGKWLRLELARRLGVAMNFKFSLLERTLWRLLRDVDPRPFKQPPELLDGDLYRFLVLSILLEYPGPELEGLRKYMGRSEESSPARWRRAWSLADRMSSLIRDYEYHRLDDFILPWLKHTPAHLQLTSHDRQLERAQGTLFYEITREPSGRRETLNAAAARNFKTLPQYAGEVMELNSAPPEIPLRCIYLFGVTQMSALHAKALAMLSRWFDLRFYFLSPLTPLLDSNDAGSLARVVRQMDVQVEAGPDRFFKHWARAGAESLARLETLVEPGGPVTWDVLDCKQPARETGAQATRPASVLSSLQASLRGEKAGEKVAQDCSLQIVGCPGVKREVESVYDSILHNLCTDRELQLTDIAILVTDMEAYRPALQAMFDRDGRLGYSLVDHSAAGVSLWGQALLGMLDLAQDNFARSQVLEVVLNPCVLARLGVERAEAQVWLHWAEELGAYHGWDVRERTERGQPADSPLFAWKQALQRLRLGRYMDGDTDPFTKVPRFGALAPHEDIHSAERRQLDAFCRAVEGLLPLLIRLRAARENGRWWADMLRHLTGHFLAIPEDRQAEARVRDGLLASLSQLELWDDLHQNASEQAKLPLALVREFVSSGLQGISASQGDYLTAGVTISALQPMRPVPFKVVYVMGMNEALFPGRNALPSLDLRSHEKQRKPGDIWPAEQNLFLLLEVLLAARQKLYFFYTNLELQKDRELLPATPLLQLRRYLEENILNGKFESVDVPLHGHDKKYLGERPPHQDVLVQYGEFSRGLAVQDGVKRGAISLSADQRKRLDAWQKKRPREFTRMAQADARKARPIRVRLRDLKDFLINPAYAILKRRLRIEDSEADDECQDDEPFVSQFFVRHDILRRALAETIRQYEAGTLPDDVKSWADWVDSVHEDYRLRCQAPTGPFGTADRLNLRGEFLNRVDGGAGLKAFLDRHPKETFCGPILLGESTAPLGAKLLFPSLWLQVPSFAEDGVPLDLRLSGHAAWAWRMQESFDLLFYGYSSSFEKPDRVFKQLLEPVLFCLALLAQEEGGPDSPRSMLETREWYIHILADDGIKSWTYAPGMIKPAEALHYLSDLARDFLDPRQFDLLPLEIVNDNEARYESAVAAEEFNALAGEEFRKDLQDAIETKREWKLDKAWDSDLIQLLAPEVSKDALAKCRRRLALLDRGPAVVRREWKAFEEEKDRVKKAKAKEKEERNLAKQKEREEKASAKAEKAQKPAKPRKSTKSENAPQLDQNESQAPQAG